MNVPAQNIKIRMEAYDHEVVDKSAADIVDTAKRTGARVAGPDPAADAHRALHRPALAAHRQEVARAVRDPHPQADPLHLRADGQDDRRDLEAEPARRRRHPDQGLAKRGAETDR